MTGIFRRSHFVLLALALAGCAGGQLTLPTVEIDGTAQELALVEAAVGNHARRSRGVTLERVRFYALSDGSRIGCGDWDAPDAYGEFGGRAPFFVRFAGDSVLQVHLDDLTGYGPARTGCDSAEARLTG